MNNIPSRTLSLSLLSLAFIMLSGCAAAVMTSAKTVKGSESNNVIIVEKTEPITAIREVTVDTSGLNKDDAEKQKDIADRVTSLLISNLEKKSLYQPKNEEAFTLTVTVRNMKQDVNERAVYAIVNILNAEKEAIFSFASVETSEGLRTINYIEETFAESAVAEIAKPVPAPAQ
ncbi:hypothetical protein [Puniceicoccus vermicola]|uniref:DUF4410 domain-containing protein n=1 Tax=Puniceicoccus vermicola TaxID=388746 RepID=A0A7X1B0T2_9BACT|nr:hypothetical protein [Puniceicoccus vermicola]MBC2603494.1 hypothetical protein [Puniceicoccus vermicola]